MDHRRIGTVTRRNFMMLGASGAVVALLPGWPPAASAQALDLDSFLELSARVTGHQGLDPVLGDAILRTLNDVGIVQDIAAAGEAEDSPARQALIKAWYLGKISPDGLDQGQDDEVERQQAEGREEGGEEEDDEDEGPPDIVVGYEATLMARVVSDMLPLRSYCGGLPHFWTEPPEDPDLASGGFGQ